MLLCAVSLRVLHVDSDSMVTSTCRGGAGQIDRCPLDAAVVELWTRDDSISLQGVRRLKRVVAGSCFNTNSLSPVLSGQGLSVITGRTSGHDTLGCQIDPNWWTHWAIYHSSHQLEACRYWVHSSVPTPRAGFNDSIGRYWVHIPVSAPTQSGFLITWMVGTGFTAQYRLPPRVGF